MVPHRRKVSPPILSLRWTLIVFIGVLLGLLNRSAPRPSTSLQAVQGSLVPASVRLPVD